MRRWVFGALCLLSTVVLSACVGGGGGTSSVPSAGTLGNPLPTTVSNGTSNTRITEYSLGATPSAGGITIANDGSVWTQSGYYQNGSLVRWFNGSAASYPVSDSTFYGLGIMTSTGQTVFGGFQNNNSSNYINLVAGVPAAGGTPQFLQSSRFFTGSGVFGQLADLTHLSNGSVWQAISYYQLGVSGQGIVQEITPGNVSITLPSGQNSSGFTYTLPTALTQGPDGNLWVAVTDMLNAGTPQVVDAAMRVYSASGSLLHVFPLPAPANAMATGPDQAVWFTENNGVIGRITASGSVNQYPTGSNTPLSGIALGGDGALWFLEPSANRIGRMTTSGSEADYAIPTANSYPLGIAGPSPGCGGKFIVWFAERASGKIAMVGYQ